MSTVAHAVRYSLPSWLVSTLLHLAACVGLALWIVPSASPVTGVQLNALLTSSEHAEPIQILPAILPDSADVVPPLATVSAEPGVITGLSELDLPQVAADAADDNIGFGDGPFAALLAADEGPNRRGQPEAAEQAAQFFGVKALGRRFVFVVDSSTSMRGPKFLAAKAELIYALNRLSREQAFFVFFFDVGTKPMPFRHGDEALQTVPPTSENLQRARRWLASIELGPDTLPYDAMRQAVEMHPDAIYLLSDGQFQDGGLTEQFLALYSPKPVIHTIAFWDLAGAAALQRIARESGGTFRFIPPGGR
jgi:hypothetical protein